MAGYFGNIPTPQATQTRDTFTATASQTSFATSGYTVGMLDVYLNGIKLASADFTATNGSDVVLASGASTGDIVEVVSFSTFETNSGVFTGDFSVDSPTFKVDSSNNRVGIGETTPLDLLQLTTTNGESNIRLHRQDTAIVNDDNYGTINWTGADSDSNADGIRGFISGKAQGTGGGFKMEFGTAAGGTAIGSDPRMLINADGVLLVGRTGSISSGGVTSDHTFEQLTDAQWVLATHSDKTNNYGIAPYYATAHDGSGNHFLYCTDASANRLKIQSDGDVKNHDNSYGSTSDERIKQDIKDANSQWDDIKALKIRNYKKKDDVRQYKDKAWEQIGVIAQELEAAGMNKLVSEGEPCEHDIKSSAEFGTLNEDGTIKEVKSKVKDVKYSVLYMKAVKALQEAMIRIETLETKVKALEAK